MQRVVLAAAVAALVGACAQVNPETPAGASYAINCPTARLEHCFAKAKELCPQGYEVIQVRRATDPILMVVAPDRLVGEAVEIIETRKKGALIVGEGKRPVGLVHYLDLLRAGVA